MSVALRDGNAIKAPVPRTAPAEDTEVAYVRQKGKWYQFRMKSENRGPTADEEDHSYRFYFQAQASVWQYNPKSGEYDIPTSRSARPTAHQGLRFSFFNSGEELRMNMGHTNGGGGGGAGGWPNDNVTEARIVIEPSSYPEGQNFTDERIFEVQAIATMKPTSKEREKGAQPLQVIARQKWKVEILKPHKKAKFTRID